MRTTVSFDLEIDAALVKEYVVDTEIYSSNAPIEDIIASYIYNTLQSNMDYDNFGCIIDKKIDVKKLA